MSVVGPSAADRLRSDLTAACLVNSGRSADVLTRFTPIDPKERSAFVNLSAAVAYAQQGMVEEAVITLLEVPAGDRLYADAHRMAVNLLHCQAIRKINTKDVVGAVAAVDEALKLDPGNEELRMILARLESAAPAAYLKSNKRREAVEAWEQAQNRDPLNGRVAHSLALAYRFWAESVEREGRFNEADPLWRKAIANWTIVTYSDSFWTQWCAERSTVYTIPDGAIEKLRGFWEAELTRRFRRLAHDARENTANAARYVRLELEYWLESSTAAAIRELGQVQCPGCGQMVLATSGSGGWMCSRPECGRSMLAYRRPHSLPFVGPNSLDRFGLWKDTLALSVSAHKLPNGEKLTGSLAKLSLPFVKSNADALTFLLDGNRFAFACIAAGRYAEALAELGAG